ncbi:MAG TPA: cell division protein FtsQ/DivIB [Steroidobacteraceae bacterium]|nr:cell division protein FtsQ/DivIB [Steroidobacteraceae bacterium]
MWLRRKNRRKPTPEAPRIRVPTIAWRRLALPALTVSAVLAGLALALAALNRPIDSIALTGRFQRVSPLDVERIVRASIHGAGLVTVDLAGICAAVKRLPWVDSVSAERSWPRGIALRIVEQVAVARWGDDGLINDRGELFASSANHIPQELPRLSGPDGTEGAVAARYLVMQARLAEAGLRLSALRLDARGAWEFDLGNGVTVRLGRKRVDERFDTFMAVGAKLVAQRATDIAYLDMRYTNGFAVGWRGGAPSDAHSSIGGAGRAYLAYGRNP